MSKTKLFLVLVIIGSLALVSSAWSQDCDNLLKEEMYQEDWDAYMNCLEGEINEVEDTESDLDAQLEALEAELAELEAEEKSFSGEAEAIEARIAELDETLSGLNSLLAELDALPTQYTVVPGDYLAKISGREDIYRDPAKWPRIYRANRYDPKDPSTVGVREKRDGSTGKFYMRNPNLIYPGWILKIPRDWPKTIEVIRGDSLWKISGFWWVNDDPLEWRELYEKNKDEIKDPDLIYPDQQFRIRD
jgi:nucleoid-associated protein YgaU